MSGAAARQSAGGGTAASAPSSSPRRAKLAAFLISGDVDLWPEISVHLPTKLNFRQVDSIAELFREVPPDRPAVVLWDARGCADKVGELSRLQSHSACFATLVLDDDDSAWVTAVQQGQIVGLVPLPVDQSRLVGALGGAYEEVNARVALLGERSAAPASRGGGRGIPRMAIAGVFAILLAAAAGLVLWRQAGDPRESSPAPGAVPPPARSAPAPAPAPEAPATAERLPQASEEKVDALIDQAQRAMRERHFIDPVEGSALSLYRSALALDPSSGEARQGLQRLAELLLVRVQSALDERQFDAALQALETARSIDPSDPRLAAFDERIAKLRTELGPAEILAAINAQNFDRAAQLIDQASRSRSIGESKLGQLREDMRRRRADSDDSRQAESRELARRLMLAARADIAQLKFDEADRLAAKLRSIGVPLLQVAGLQHDIAMARAQQAAAAAPEPPARAAPDASQTDSQAASLPEPAAPPGIPSAAGAAPAGGPKEVAEASLTRTRPLEIDYPSSALSKEIEGQVEIAYVVTAKGVVSGLKVLAATPAGVFDKAATTAVSRLRYKPVIDAGRPTAVSTRMLVTFRLAK